MTTLSHEPLPLHAGHWLWDGLYAAPVVLLALAFGVQALRRRLRGELPPDDLEEHEDDGP